MNFHLGCRRVCQFCQKTMGYKPGESGTETHGICDGCGLAEAFRREALSHIASCKMCGLVSFRIQDVLPRCEEGNELVEKWRRALEEAKTPRSGWPE
jgi:hypothetical protein